MAPGQVNRPAYSATCNQVPELAARRLPRALIVGVVAVLFGLGIAVFRANSDQRVVEPFPGFPAVTMDPEPGFRTADAFSMFGRPMDFQVYYLAGKALSAGKPVYENGFLVTNWGQGFHLPFTYPPFAAWLASFYSNLSLSGAIFIWQASSLLIFAMVLTGILVGKRDERHSRVGLAEVAFVLLLMIAAFAFAPVRSSFYWGQVNMPVMGLVAADFLVIKRWPAIRENGWRQDSWWAGIGVGLAAALKVYPAFFGLLFILQRRWRAAIFSAITFFITVGIGFLFVPESGDYWTKTLTATERFGGLENITSQSIKISLARDFDNDNVVLWLVLAIGITTLVSYAARCALRRGDIAVALSLVGLCACVVSPFSWHHYYLWAITLVIGLVLNVLARLGSVGEVVPRLAAVGGVVAGAAVAALGVAALWPYVSVVFFYPFDVYEMAKSSNPFAASATVWWSVFLIVAVAGYYARSHGRVAIASGKAAVANEQAAVAEETEATGEGIGAVVAGTGAAIAAGE